MLLRACCTSRPADVADATGVEAWLHTLPAYRQALADYKRQVVSLSSAAIEACDSRIAAIQRQRAAAEAAADGRIRELVSQGSSLLTKLRAGLGEHQQERHEKQAQRQGAKVLAAPSGQQPRHASPDVHPALSVEGPDSPLPLPTGPAAGTPRGDGRGAAESPQQRLPAAAKRLQQLGPDSGGSSLKKSQHQAAKRLRLELSDSMQAADSFTCTDEAAVYSAPC
jgi:hypothetical protein